MIKTAAIGQTIIYYPETADFEKEMADRFLPNGMECAPAVVLQSFDEGKTLNLMLLTAENRDGRTPTKLKWSVKHKSMVDSPAERYWDFPENE